MTDYAAAISGDLNTLLGTQGAAATVANPIPAPPDTDRPSTVDRNPTTVDGPPVAPAKRRRRKPPEEHWAARHVRRTFHLPIDTSEALDAEVNADEDLSLASAVTEALDEWLARRRRAAARKERP